MNPGDGRSVRPLTGEARSAAARHPESLSITQRAMLSMLRGCCEDAARMLPGPVGNASASGLC